MSVKNNIAKVMRYLKKNGFTNTMYAMVERVFFGYHKNYTYNAPTEKKLQLQRETKFASDILVSIVVPTYETKEKHLREMMESVLSQTYQNLELILADASSTSSVSDVVKTYEDARIVYKKLAKNDGISENTNEGILMAKGRYIALLDHDDLLTFDAVFEVVKKIEEEKNAGKVAKIIFSDEDKCNSEANVFFAPHFKMGYNRELLFTNNYICHFLVCEAELMKKLLLRKEFDGAQDFDFVLRATDYVNCEAELGGQVSICHIPQILYHWRCHENSTAENPESKMYAYEAGKRAVQAAFDEMGRNLQVVHSKHLGFYQSAVGDKTELFEANDKLGCIGGAVYKGKKIVGGAMDEKGNILYGGLHKRFEGYMNRAHLMQNAYAVDIRNVLVCEPLCPLLEETIENSKKQKNPDYVKISLEFCEKVKNMGYDIIYWEP